LDTIIHHTLLYSCNYVKQELPTSQPANQLTNKQTSSQMQYIEDL